MKKLSIMLLACTVLVGVFAVNNCKPAVAADNDSITENVVYGVQSSFYHGEPTLRVGSEGEYVRELQQKLKDLHYRDVGAVDGIFGENTRRAVEHFQSNNGLSVDCIVGPNTWAKLNELHWNWVNGQMQS